ncbi:ATP-binding protein, partial [archaeon]|nr:ATP-binding protein [archaeon]
MNRDAVPPNPFVGLRPFESRDSLYYFGRKEQTHALLKQLDSHRFVAVVGSSGCGKSSLVRAGLIPNLEAGFLVQDRDLWKIATFKPGAAPLYHLAAAVAAVGESVERRQAANQLQEVVQRRGARALTDAIRTNLEDEDSNLLIVVDQFEELFRFQQAKTVQVREEAAEFVSALLYLADQTRVPVYVVLTMRSDFLGECDAYQGLPEAMNKSQYLVPRLTRRQRREAFMGPVRLAGADITPRLMDRLLNESLDTRDDLPILQHVLMRTWAVWAGDGRRGPIDLEHYERSGGLQNALSLHADEALNGLNREQHLISKRMFQVVSSGDPAADPLVDISHESLIRQWNTLADWVDEEAESARIYQRMAQSAELHAAAKAGLYKETDLQVALDWQRQQQPTAEWAGRYSPNFSRAMRFLEQSVSKQKTNKQFIISLIVCVYACFYSWLVIATTDDVSLATNSAFLPIIGTAMPADLVYLICPLVMISIYAWFLFHLQRLLVILSSQPKVLKTGKSFMARLEQTGMHALAWITMPLAFLGLWVRYLPRRDWTVTGFQIVFMTLSIFMALIFHRSSRPGDTGTRPLLRQQIRVSGLACMLLTASALWALSFGAFNGTPERHLKRYGDMHALVPWLFHELGYDVFFDLREQRVSKLPEDYWLIASPADRMRAIQGAPLKKANLRYADFYQAFVVKANLRNA